MAKLRMGRVTVMSAVVVAAIALFPLLATAQKYKTFTSEEFGFSMQYPASWIKIDNPSGNYYVVFQAPDKVKGFRSRIHVAAHKPVKDPISVFLQEMRNGIKDLQKSSKKGAKGKQDVRIIDEGEFRCDVPKAHYFFIQAWEEKLKLWMGIVIVFYKHDSTLLRISCLAPYDLMDNYHEMFNTVLTSVKFGPVGAAAKPSKPEAVPPPAPGTTTKPAPAPGPGSLTKPTAPAPTRQPMPATRAPRVAPSPSAPSQPSRPLGTGPAPAPSRPTTGPSSTPRLPGGPRPSPPPGAGIVE